MDLPTANIEGFSFYKDSAEQNGDFFYVIPQQHPKEIFVDVPGHQQKIPLVLKIYIGGLSVIGLFIVFRMLQKASRN
jgi:hypothetical protein